MTAPTLVLGKGSLPDSSAFDLSIAVDKPQPVCPWSPSAAQAPSGDMWLDYSYPAGYQRLTREASSSDSDQQLPESGDSAEMRDAQRVRSSIDAAIEVIVEQGRVLGFSASRCEMILTELLQNATQYGVIHSCVDYAGLVRLAWEFEQQSEGCVLTLAVSNPVKKLFNPAKYCNLSLDDYLDAAAEGTNGHVAVALFTGFLSLGEKLHYLWDLPSRERIVCRIAPCNESDERLNEASDIVSPVVVEVSKYDEFGNELPYSLDRFLADVEVGLPTEAVTVAGVFQNG